ncbi:MAG TPA: hypothetical protein VGJ21_07055 [Terracidiphilus sp.]|jgi:hypothetical protein
MKRCFGFALLLSLLSIPAFAAKNEQSVTFDNTVTVGSTKLPAGQYKVSWTGTAPNVQVTLVQKDARHPLAATASATLTDEKHGQVQFTTGDQSGVTTLKQLQLRSVSLVFTSSPASGQ